MVTLFTYDRMGREECVKGPFFSISYAFLQPHFSEISLSPATVGTGVTTTWLRNHYDDKGRIMLLEQSGGINTMFAHENLTTRVTDPDGHSKTQVMDALGRVVTVTEHGPSDFSVTYTYDPAGMLLKVSRTNPATGSAIENIVTYNTLGQKTAMSDPDMGNWSYTYDLNGNLATQTDARNITLAFDYDALNRRILKTYPDSSTASWSYDGSVNGIGLPYKKANANASTRYAEYDEMGRLLSETTTIGAKAIQTDRTWDLAGRPASKEVPFL